MDILSYLWTRLSSFIRAVLGLPPIPSRLVQQVVPVIGRPPVIGVSLALTLYTYPDILYDILHGVRICRIRLKKRTGKMGEHEYLLIDVDDGALPIPSYLGQVVVERLYKLPHSAYSYLHDTPTHCRDHINFAPPNTFRDLTVIDLRFRDESPGPLFYTLLLAADVVHAHFPTSILLPRQCFWFAGSLLCMLLDNAVDPALTRSGASTHFAYAYDRSAPTADSVVKARRAGTFKELFRLVTNQSIDVLYSTELKPAFDKRKAEVDGIIWQRLKEFRWTAFAQREIARIKEELARELARKDQELALKDKELEQMRKEVALLQAKYGQE
ncbi:hypothetical protein C8Q77DRAFT_1074822 [Trametes polyzona]|nr:hypothetical protein C8Q77DRAFT_1074822 [Trametes polyzona]